MCSEPSVIFVVPFTIVQNQLGLSLKVIITRRSFISEKIYFLTCRQKSIYFSVAKIPKQPGNFAAFSRRETDLYSSLQCCYHVV